MKKRYALPLVFLIYFVIAIPTAWFLSPDHKHAYLPVMFLNYILASALVPFYLYITQKK